MKRKGRRFFQKHDEDYVPPKDLANQDGEVPLDTEGWPEAVQLPKFLRQLHDYPAY